MLNRVTLENQLCAMNEATALEDKVADEFLVTKTIGNKEVWETLPMWEESIRAEYDQLVNQKRAVVQITQQQLRERAAAAGVEIELLPGKMVHQKGPHRRVPEQSCHLWELRHTDRAGRLRWWIGQHTSPNGPEDSSSEGLEDHGDGHQNGVPQCKAPR